MADDALLDPTAIDTSLRRIAAEILERGAPDLPSKSVRPGRAPALAFIGIRRGGEPFAKRLAALVAELTPGAPAPLAGSVDITLYRDDAATALANPRIGPSHIPFPVDGARVILVDDVLFTGRTIRAALDAVLDYGRPARIELCVVVDRGGRELPIQPDYAARRVQIGADERVEVVFRRADGTTTQGEDGDPWAILVRAGDRG